ncbi:hypothetical protein BG015_004154 [Linnemannia schmuckeri]|uniref:Enoyl reductase (ER) domain-containing protein n=1 Tax=Linnemannia schmuckeri TaxID=64567 RepID=A0A9P5VFE2_9FUNG|nr:hypothetical protein BG015_004154 [Linnemannia schmuckeri]
MTRDEKEMASSAASQAVEPGDQQHRKKQQHDHSAVDDNATFTGYASSGGATLHRITFSPRTLGPKDVEIDIWYAGICGSDLHILEEDWGELHGEVVPGHQIAGTVAAAGPEALYKVGDRVGASLVIDACMECEECKAGQEQYCAMKTLMYKDTFKDGCPAPSYGGFANRIRLCSEFVYKLPNEIHLSHAAPLFCAGLTTFTALRKYGAGADKTVGVKGIGALGHFAIQYAKAMGSKEIVAITDSDINSEDVTKLGATRCIDFSNKDHLHAERHKMDLLLVNSFDESTKWEDVLSLVSNHGTVVILALSKVPIRIPTMQFMHRDIKIVSSFQGGRKDIKEMLEFTAKHDVHPWIVKVPFDKINDAIELQKKKTARFCIVLEADESKEKGSNVEANKPVAEQYLKD